MLLIFSMLNTSCKEQSAKVVDTSNKKYGGIFRVNIDSEGPSTFFPAEALISNSITAVSIGYETLLKYNDAGTEIEGLLAKDWEINEAGDEYTIFLRENIYFHNDDCFKDGVGRELNSQDIAYCLTQLCVKSKINRFSQFLTDFIAGGKERNENKNFGDENQFLEGIEIIDDYTLKIKLVEPSYSFINFLTHYATSIYPKEAKIAYGEAISRHMVGTGPYMLKTEFPGKSVIFTRNNNYWMEDTEGNPLPYLDGIKITYADNSNDILDAAHEQRLDLIIDKNSKLLNKLPLIDPENPASKGFKLNHPPAWDVQFYSFLMTDTLYQDVRVRKAINYAIDRKFIVDSIFHGKVQIANYGIIPNTFTEYIETGFEFNPEKARELLAQAGYNSSSKIPKLSLHITNSDIALETAEIVQTMLRDNLGIITEVSALNVNMHYEKYDASMLPLAEVRWEADYFDPDNFLSLFLSEQTPENGGLNSGLYSNPEFDKLYYEAIKEFDKTKRIEKFKGANKILYETAALVPLYTTLNSYAVSSRTRSLKDVSTSDINLTNTYFEK